MFCHFQYLRYPQDHAFDLELTRLLIESVLAYRIHFLRIVLVPPLEIFITKKKRLNSVSYHFQSKSTWKIRITEL